MNPPAPVQRDETLLTQAITDIQGSIHANDNKSSAGLVVQGLLAAAVVTLVTQLGGVYGAGSDAAQIAIRFCLAGALATALVSILFFISAIFPYNPELIADRLRRRQGNPYKEVYFPDVEKLREAAKSDDAFDKFVSSLEEDVRTLRDDPDAATREYVGELLKVADIRAHEATQAERGFKFLRAELLLVTAYLMLAGFIAGEIPGFISASNHAPGLHWNLMTDGARRSVSSGTRISVHTDNPIEVRLVTATEGAQLAGVRLVRRTTLRCIRHGRVRNILAGPPSFQRVNSPEGDPALASEFRPRPRHCPPGLRYAGFAERFSAAADDVAGREITGWLLLLGPNRLG